MHKQTSCAGSRTEIKVNQFVKINNINTSHEVVRTCPVARSGHRAVADSNNIWIFGGYNPNTEQVVNNQFFPLFKELWNYNIYTKQWTKINCTGHVPSKLASHSAIIENHYLIMFGGTGYPFGENSSNKLSICNLDTGHWRTAYCSGSLPDEIYGQAMINVHNNLYVFGGTTGFIYNSDMYKLNMDTLIWEYIFPNNHYTTTPAERYRHEIVFSNDKLVVLGGGTSDTVCPLVNIPMYDLKSNNWIYRTSLPDRNVKPGFPKPRRCHSCVQLGNAAYICGGYDDNEITGDLWKIDLNTLQWTKMANMPNPVYFHSCAVTTDGCMFVFGGVSSIVPMERTGDFYKIWLKIPSLQTLCWMALVDHFPHLLKLPHSKLIQLGILKEFINKLPCPEGA